MSSPQCFFLFLLPIFQSVAFGWVVRICVSGTTETTGGIGVADLAPLGDESGRRPLTRARPAAPMVRNGYGAHRAAGAPTARTCRGARKAAWPWLAGACVATTTTTCVGHAEPLTSFPQNRNGRRRKKEASDLGRRPISRSTASARYPPSRLARVGSTRPVAAAPWRRTSARAQHEI